MKRIAGHTLSPDVLDSHHHICDLINIEYPVLSLFTDGRNDWIYLWCDRNQSGLNRWLLFPTNRELLVGYLREKAPMLALLNQAQRHWILDEAGWDYAVAGGSKESIKARRYLRSVSLDSVREYWPTEDSFFDGSLTNDLDLTRELTPTEFDVPIKGTWFSTDFLFLFKRYERLYAFFYATRPRFVKSIESTLRRLLRSPWEGGYSRVNLYTHLARQIPGLHTLKVQEIEYASPGEVTFQAIAEIGASIQNSVVLLVEQYDGVNAACERIRKMLSSSGLNRINLSEYSDASIDLTAEKMSSLTNECDYIANILKVSKEFSILREHSPNTVVYSKAVTSFVRQLDKLADLRRHDMLNF
jgi:hypothetical protein